MTEDTYIGSPDNPKTAGIVCYLTFIGWLIAYFALYGDPKTPFAAYHLRQTLLLHIITAGINIIIRFALPADVLSFVISTVVGILLFILWLTGVIHAVNGRMKPIPLIGIPAQKIFSGI